MFTLDKRADAALSLQMRLVNGYTSFVMVNEQIVENADGLPSLVVVPQIANPLELNSINKFQINACERSISELQASKAYLNVPKFLRRGASPKKIDVQMSLTSTLFARRTTSEDSFESVVLKKVDKKLTRTLFKGKIPCLKILKTWGLNQDIVNSIREYFAQHNIIYSLRYLAKALLWLNEQQNALSTASIDILQSKIDGAVSSDLVAMESLI